MVQHHHRDSQSRVARLDGVGPVDPFSERESSLRLLERRLELRTMVVKPGKVVAHRDQRRRLGSARPLENIEGEKQVLLFIVVAALLLAEFGQVHMERSGNSRILAEAGRGNAKGLLKLFECRLEEAHLNEHRSEAETIDHRTDVQGSQDLNPRGKSKLRVLDCLPGVPHVVVGARDRLLRIDDADRVASAARLGLEREVEGLKRLLVLARVHQRDADVVVALGHLVVEFPIKLRPQ